MLKDGTTGLLSNYPKALRRVIQGYRKQHSVEKEIAYVFVAGKSATGKRGYMPKKRQYGFVYTEGHGSLCKLPQKQERLKLENKSFTSNLGKHEKDPLQRITDHQNSFGTRKW